MEYKLLEADNISKDLSVTEKILMNRGINIEDISHYLNTEDFDIIDPLCIANIEDGVKMLIKTISENKKILIQVDSDCDGYTSSAVLINYLNYIFPAFVQNNVSYRIHDGKQHGILPDTIPEDISLVIVPDAGSNDYLEHEYLTKQRNLRVLVIDHHEAEKVSEYACIINNQLCDYPNKTLSGVGMVYKFCCYIDKLLNIDCAERCLDLVALGLIADMMDLRNFETKHLIQKGINNIHNPFFSEMCKKNAYSLGEEITPIGVAFYIAPYVNATIRVGEPQEKYTLFESILETKAYEEIPSTKRGCKGQFETRVEQACRNCTNVKNRQTRLRDEGLEIIEKMIIENNLLDNKILVVPLNEEIEINKNLTGLIANQLMAKYQIPVLLLHKKVITADVKNDTDWEKWINKKREINNIGKVVWEGSGRGYDKSKFQDFRSFLNESNLVEYAQGHANAFGVCILDSNLNKLIEYANEQLKDFNFTPMYKVDFIFNYGNFNKNDILDIANLKYLWGQGVDECMIAIENIPITNNITLMSPQKNPTLKITLPNGVNIIKFKSSQEEYDSLLTKDKVNLINVVGKCEKNEWNGNITPQVIVEKYEIISHMKYYF